MLNVGVILVQHFIGRYSQCSRYRTIFHVIPDIISYTKALLMQGFLFFEEGSPSPTTGDFKLSIGMPGGRPLQEKVTGRFNL